MDAYYIVKALNNNVLLCENDGKEYVLMGKGLGFNAQPGESVPREKADKIFLFMNEDILNKYFQLLEHVPEKILDVSAEIISMVENTTRTKLDEHIHIALTDHINFLVARLEQDIDIVNPFSEEIPALYPEEHQLAEKAVELLRERLTNRIPDSEVGFITLHIHSAKVRNSVSETLKNTKLYQKCINIIEREAKVKIDSKSINYARMITHLRFAIERLRTNNVEKNMLLHSIKKKFPREYGIAAKILNLVHDTLGLEVMDDEIGYLTIHVYRVLKGGKV